MSLPQDWADRLFLRLSVRYGESFLGQYRNQDMAAVKADWADVLDGWERCPSAIAWALDSLPERAPNAITFRNLCRAAPQAPQALQLLPPKADPQKVAEIVASARIGRSADPSRSPAQSVIDGIIQILTKKTEAPGRAQRQFVERCVTMLGANDPRREQLRRLGFKIDAAQPEAVAA